MKILSVISISILIIGCGRSGNGVTQSECVSKKTSSLSSLHHKRANQKTLEIFKGKKHQQAGVKTGTKQELILTENIESGPEFDHSVNPGHWAGVYHDYQSNTLKVSDVNLKDQTFHFSLLLVTTKECTGEINGNHSARPPLRRPPVDKKACFHRDRGHHPCAGNRR